MPAQAVDISYLFKYTENITFISAAYQALLDRPIGPEELRHANQMLVSGLSRKGFIYWISRSPEFNSRFTIKGLDSYRLPCYLYKGCEKVANHLNLRHRVPAKFVPNIPLPSSGPVGFAAPANASTMEFETEYSALSLGQICQIPLAFPDFIQGNVWHAVGYLAPELLNPRQIKGMTEPEGFQIPAQKQNFFITSPEVIFQLITQERLEKLAQRTEDAFLFTMPVLPSSQSMYTIVWDRSWNEAETAFQGFLCRWMHGSANRGGFSIINHSNEYRKVSVSFTLRSPLPGSAATIRFGDWETTFSFKDTLCPVICELWLNPGFNRLLLTYLGPGFTAPQSEAWTAKLAISGLSLTDMLQAGEALQGESAYHLSETDLGGGYLPYLLPDSYIRSRLHHSGFFEVRAASVSSTYTVQEVDTTRYSYFGDERGRDCYYTFREAPIRPGLAVFPSVTVYLARRTSSFYEKPFLSV